MKAFGILKTFLPSVEGFSPTPYWDNKQWSWGFGTAAGFDKNIKPTGTITKTQALIDTTLHFTKDYNILKSKLTVPLNANNWAALLSFSYNLGSGNALSIIPLINRNDPNFSNVFLSYNKASGSHNPALAERRKKELKLYFS